MIAAYALLLVMQQGPIRGVVVDAATGAPIVGAQLTARGAATRSDAEGRFAIAAIAGDTIRARRIGYRETLAIIVERTVLIRMTSAATVLSSVAVRDSTSVARLSVTRSTTDLHEQGTRTTGGAIAAMPFVSARNSRGESVISVRGARAEQVLVTLDGMPLNDPATGRADVSDVPLAALGGITVTPGAAATSFGSGASGGVVALTSGDAGVVSLSTSTLGGVSLEGAGALSSGRTHLRIGGAVSRARNDFEFVNDAGARDTIERRVNADESHASVFASGFLRGVQFTALYAARDRGLGGAKNVRAYDDARETSDRRLARVQIGSERWLAHAGVRRLALHYRDNAPELASDAFGTSVDAGVQTSARSVTLRAGATQEHTWGSTLPEADRRSAFASAGKRWETRAMVADANVRIDAVERFGEHVSPSLSAEGTGRIRPFARLGQGFRLPAFYDLYVPTPLGFVSTRVRPERVVADAELGLRVAERNVTFSGSVFERVTDDAVVWFPGNFTWSPRNVSRERVLGAEAVASYTSTRLRIESWAAAYDTKLHTAEIDIPTPYVPTLTGGVNARLEFGRLVIAPSLSARGRRPFAVAAPSRELELPGVALVDLTVSYRTSTRAGTALLSASVINAGNTSWESIRRFPSPGRVWQAAITVKP